jgi:heat shock protein HslJ
MKKIMLLAGIAGVLLAGACHSSGKSRAAREDTMNTGEILEKKWKLIELRGQPVADIINGKMPFIQLLKTDSRYVGTAGCNGIGGTYTLTGNNRIQFSRGMSTMMACEHMEIEQGLVEVLQMADNYSISGNTLSLNKARMAPLARFEAVTP